MRKIWKSEEIEFLINNIEEFSLREIGIKLGRTERSIQHKCSELQISKREPQVGDKYERLIINEIFVVEKHNRNITMTLCTCECGTKKEIRLNSLVQSTTKSCGCLAKDTSRERGYYQNKTHGLTNHKLYGVWRGMKERCNYEKNKKYHNYGGRGIKVCPEWESDFKIFYNWAMENGWKQGLKIERKNGNLGYCPENCKIATQKEQCNNRCNNRMVTAFGETKNVVKWMEDDRCVVKNFRALMSRLNNTKWTAEESLTIPLNIKKGA